MNLWNLVISPLKKSTVKLKRSSVITNCIRKTTKGRLNAYIRELGIITLQSFAISCRKVYKRYVKGHLTCIMKSYNVSRYAFKHPMSGKLTFFNYFRTRTLFDLCQHQCTNIYRYTCYLLFFLIVHSLYRFNI